MSRTILRARAGRSAAYGVVLVALLTGTPMGGAAEQRAEAAPSMVEWLEPPLPTNKPQTAAEEEAGKAQGRTLPRPEVLQPALDPALPVYRPCQGHELQGSFKGTSSDVLPGLVKLWIQRFNAYCPQVHIDIAPPYAGSLGAKELIGQKIDFAFVSRELKPDDIEEFRQRFGYAPMSIPVAGGSYRHFGFLDAIGFFVNKGNPLERITYAQLDAILSSTRHRGAEPITRWGQLGLTGEWADKPIHVYAVKPWNGFEEFIRQRVLSTAGQRGEWRTDLNFEHLIFPVVSHIAQDRYGLGYSGLAFVDAGVKSLSVAQNDQGPFYSPSYENVALETYPLTRLIYFNFNRPPGEPLPAALEAFLRFILSKEGQQVVLDEAIFLPLRADVAAQARRRLVEPTPDASPATTGAKLITCAGGETMQPLALHWASAFQAQHPTVQIKVDTSAKLSADGFSALLDGRVSCVLMVREPFAAEAQAFEHRFGHAPGLLRVATGSFDTRGGTHAIAIYTNSANPLRRISLEQLEAVFAAAPQSGKVPIVKWGQLGLKGSWTDKPVHVYGMLPRRETGNPPGIVNFLQQRILSGGAWRSDLRVQTDASGRSALQAIVQQVAEDPAGIGYSGFGFRQPGVRALAIGATDDGPFIEGVRASVSDRTYPLTRSVYIAFDPNVMASPDLPLPDFLRYVLSSEAQRAIADDPEGFIPLPANELEASRQSLGYGPHLQSSSSQL